MLVCLVVVSCCLSSLGFGQPKTFLTHTAATSSISSPSLSGYFVSNQGIYPSEILFYTNTRNASIFFTSQGLLFQSVDLRTAKNGDSVPASAFVGYRMNFVQARAKQVVGLERQIYQVNYLRGKNPANWRTHVPTFTKISYRELYSGIDLTYTLEGGALKYEYVLQPHAVIDNIELRYDNIQALTLDRNGDLLLHINGEVVRNTMPVAYQVIAGQRVPVSVKFKLTGPVSYGFGVENYNPAYPLIIDPLSYSTYLGNTQYDLAYAIAIDSSGNTYITGKTTSLSFPTYSSNASGPYKTVNTNGEVFVTKLKADGTSLLYSTFLGGNQEEEGYGIAVDGSGYAYVTGYTKSTDFPKVSASGTPYTSDYTGNSDVFITVINADGSGVLYSTSFGGSLDDVGNSIQLDKSGYIYIGGKTASTNFPIKNAFDTTFVGASEGFICKLAPLGGGKNDLVYSSFWGGSGIDAVTAIAVNSYGYAHLAGYTLSSNFPTTTGAYDTSFNYGYDAVVGKVAASPTGSTDDLLYSTYIGGMSTDEAQAIAVDGSGSIYISGYTAYAEVNFPTTPGAYSTTHHGGDDAFLAKIYPTGKDSADLLYSTFLGGVGTDEGLGLALDSSSNVYLVGTTNSYDFIPRLGATSWVRADTNSDVFLMKLNTSNASVLYSTVLAGTNSDYGSAITFFESAGKAYITGYTTSLDYPTTSGAYDTIYSLNTDVYITAVAIPTITAVSPNEGPSSGGTAITITGTNFYSPAVITIGGNSATSVTVKDATQITCVTPAGSAGAQAILIALGGDRAVPLENVCLPSGFNYTSSGGSSGGKGGGGGCGATGLELVVLLLLCSLMRKGKFPGFLFKS